MIARTLRVGAAAVLLAGSLWAGARPAGPLPPLGALLDPARGVWANARVDARAADEGSAVIPGLGADVKVLYDVRAVPHIFAAREEDAYRALGWVVARDRLFQLYVQTLAASGRRTELGGGGGGGAPPPPRAARPRPPPPPPPAPNRAEQSRPRADGIAFVQRCHNLARRNLAIFFQLREFCAAARDHLLTPAFAISASGVIRPSLSQSRPTKPPSIGSSVSGVPPSASAIVFG